MIIIKKKKKYIEYGFKRNYVVIAKFLDIPGMESEKKNSIAIFPPKFLDIPGLESEKKIL